VTRAAFTAAYSIWFELTQTGNYTRERDSRITRHLSAPDRAADPAQAINCAATHPEAVALTTIMASPHWKAVLTSRRPARDVARGFVVYRTTSKNEMKTSPQPQPPAATS
jgi:hypothetical protein